MFKNLDISISKISYSKNTISKRESFIMKYTEQELKDKTYAILRSNPLNLYTDKIVVEDRKCIGRKEYLTSDTKKSFKEVIVSVLENTIKTIVAGHWVLMKIRSALTISFPSE